jgi:hypothetical protein
MLRSCGSSRAWRGDEKHGHRAAQLSAVGTTADGAQASKTGVIIQRPGEPIYKTYRSAHENRQLTFGYIPKVMGPYDVFSALDSEKTFRHQ